MGKIREKEPSQSYLDKRLLINVLLLALSFIVLLNLFLLFNISSPLTPQVPVSINVTFVIDSSCNVCHNLTILKHKLFLGRFPSVNETVVEVDDAKALLMFYNISHVPAVIISPNDDRVSMPFPKIGNSYVVEFPPPFVDVVSGKVRGIISAMLIEAPNCPYCTSINRLVADLSLLAYVDSVKRYSVQDQKAMELMLRYNLSKLPALILSKEAEQYPVLREQWQRIGIRAEDGFFVSHNPLPPYVVVSTGRVVGLVNITTIADPECAVCYNMGKLVEGLRQTGIVVQTVNDLSVNQQEAKEMIAKYQVEYLPAMVVSSEVGEYDFFEQIWSDMGTKEEDGSFVLRNITRIPLSVFLELKTGQVRQG